MTSWILQMPTDFHSSVTYNAYLGVVMPDASGSHTSGQTLKFWTLPFTCSDCDALPTISGYESWINKATM